MHFAIKIVCCSCALGVLLFSGPSFSAQEPSDRTKETVGQCVKGGKSLSSVKAPADCVQRGGAWMELDPRIKATVPVEKEKASQKSSSGGKK
jgi:hypothetical protein